MINKPSRQKKWIDVSVALESGMAHWDKDPDVCIKRRPSSKEKTISKITLISMGPHTGTHMDAPLHFIAGGKSLDRMPFAAVIGKARVLTIKSKKCITVKELLPYRIKHGERLIFKTANSNYWKANKFSKNFVYISVDAARYLVARGVRTVGIDYLSVDSYNNNDAETHRILLKAGVWVIEGLNLKGVKPGNYDLICLPLRISNSDGGPARAVISPC